MYYRYVVYCDKVFTITIILHTLLPPPAVHVVLKLKLYTGTCSTVHVCVCVCTYIHDMYPGYTHTFILIRTNFYSDSYSYVNPINSSSGIVVQGIPLFCAPARTVNICLLDNEKLHRGPIKASLN